MTPSSFFSEILNDLKQNEYYSNLLNSKLDNTISIFDINKIQNALLFKDRMSYLEHLIFRNINVAACLDEIGNLLAYIIHDNNKFFQLLWKITLHYQYLQYYGHKNLCKEDLLVFYTYQSILKDYAIIGGYDIDDKHNLIN